MVFVFFSLLISSKNRRHFPTDSDVRLLVAGRFEGTGAVEIEKSV